MDLQAGKLVWVECREGQYPFFFYEYHDGKLMIGTPPEFDEPGKYLVMSLGVYGQRTVPTVKQNPDKKTQYLKFLTGSGAWYMKLTGFGGEPEHLRFLHETK